MALIQQPITDTGFELVEFDEEQEKNSQLTSVLEALGVEPDEILLKVYRVNEMGKDAQIFDCPADAIEGMEERLRKSYGKGDYKIKIFAPTDSGGKAVRKVIKMSIDTPIEPDTTEPAKTDDISGVITSMMQAMQTQSTSMMNTFRESQLESQNKTQELIIAMMSNKSSDEKKPSFIEQLAALKAIMPEPEKQKDPMDSILAMLKVTEKVKESVSPEPAPSEGSMGQLLNMGSQLIEAAKNSPAKPIHQQPLTRPNIDPKTGLAVQPQIIEKESKQQPEQQDMNFIVKHQLKNHLQMLCTKAADGRAPALWADLTIDEIPEKFYPQLIVVLGDNDTDGYTSMVEINPAIAQHEAWFMEFIAEIRAAFADDGSDDNVAGDGESLTIDSESGDDNANIDLPITENACKNQTIIDNTDNSDT